MDDIVVTGLGGIKVTLLKHSISPSGQQIASFELDYPRFFHSELMTHRLLSRNAASSRAIPIKMAIKQVRENPAMPVHWGKNQPGMKAREELSGCRKHLAELLWGAAAKCAAGIASLMDKVGLHKQIANRILEPFQMIKVVVTATSYDNFFYLRNHKDAQPEFQELARCMYSAIGKSTPESLEVGEWHLPYVDSYRDEYGTQVFFLQEVVTETKNEIIHVGIRKNVLTLEEAQKLSASLCAQVSYRKSDESLEKALSIYEILVGMKPAHASPFEHQATPLQSSYGSDYGDTESRWPEGVTHADRRNILWSGNFCGWIQYRQLIKDNTCWDYEAWK